VSGVDSDSTGEAAGLRALIERIEHLHEERREISNCIADIYREARGRGYDVKALRQVVRIRARSPDKYREEQGFIEVYLRAIGIDAGFAHSFGMSPDEILRGSDLFPSDLADAPTRMPTS
jgi:uncharacterized protein (UPF0335 family)